MSIDAEATAGIDLGPLTLRALGGIEATLDGIHQSLKSIHALEEAYQFGPRTIKFQANFTTNASGTVGEMDLGGPHVGRLWQVRTISIGGSLWTTTVTGSALIVVSGSRNTTPATTDVVDEAGSLPAVAQYSTGQIVIRNPNRLRVVLFGTLSTSTQYVAGGWATDMPDKREKIEAGL